LNADIGGKRVLLIDDVSDSGDTFQLALHHLEGYGNPACLQTGVLHHKATSVFKPDYCAKRIVKWRWITYPWAVVEDLSVAVSHMKQLPRDENALRSKLKDEMRITLPKRVLTQIASVVLSKVTS
jgi:hypoxanthine phosphoribosyltransferase